LFTHIHASYGVFANTMVEPVPGSWILIQLPGVGEAIAFAK
jgi:hypothetical protein